MNESKLRVFEQGESSNRASYTREEIPTHERLPSQYFKVNKPKREYKTSGEYIEKYQSTMIKYG